MEVVRPLSIKTSMSEMGQSRHFDRPLLTSGLPRFIAERGVIKEGSPVLVRFISQVASRFGLVVTQKVAATGELGGFSR